MKTWLKILMVVALGTGLTRLARADPATQGSDAAAIQAIQQAPDPSAAVAAYANGFASDRHDPKLHAAYVARMIDLGLPELAYHQAQLLTTLDASNGLGWGVIAYVDARRAQMNDAISAIILAGQAAPDSKFVQRTAGEIVAWYDSKNDQTQMPDSVKTGLNKIRELLNDRADFTNAYTTAQKAYQTQTKPPPVAPTPQSTQSVAPPQSYQAVPNTYPPTTYAPDYPLYDDLYYADWGPAWIEPYPWCWWQPVGCFVGCGFFPFGAVVVCDDFDHFHHFHHHDGDFHHQHDWNNSTAWHHDSNGRTHFFGAPAKPDATLTHWTHANFQPTRSSTAATAPFEHRTGAPVFSGAGSHSVVTPQVIRTPTASANRSWSSGPTIYRGVPAPAPSYHAPGSIYRPAPSRGTGSSASFHPVQRFSGGWAGNYHSAPAPSRGVSGGGEFHGGGGFGGSGLHGGGFGGGGGGHR